LSVFERFRQVAAQVRRLIAAEESKFKVNRQMAALSRANPVVSSAFLLCCRDCAFVTSTTTSTTRPTTIQLQNYESIDNNSLSSLNVLEDGVWYWRQHPLQYFRLGTSMGNISPNIITYLKFSTSGSEFAKICHRPIEITKEKILGRGHLLPTHHHLSVRPPTLISR